MKILAFQKVDPITQCSSLGASFVCWSTTVCCCTGCLNVCTCASTHTAGLAEQAIYHRHYQTGCNAKHRQSTGHWPQTPGTSVWILLCHSAALWPGKSFNFSNTMNSTLFSLMCRQEDATIKNTITWEPLALHKYIKLQKSY